MKRITIKDLARLLDMSPSTISRALSDHPDISDSTKKRVIQLAKELNYTKNIHARFFRKQNSGLVALILPEINMFFTPSLIQEINKTFTSTNYSLITFLSDDSYEREKEIIHQCLSWAVEGVLLSLSKETSNLNHLLPLTEAKIKCVLLDKSLESNNYPSVLIDSENASFKAVNYLIKKGHRNILGIFGNPTLNISRKRLNGYKKALQENNIPILKQNIIFLEEITNLDFILPSVLNQHQNITAIFTMSDELLAKSLFHLNQLKYSIPKDISIISISDGMYPYLVYPQVTHILDSGSKMGEIASKLLLESIIYNKKKQDYSIVVSTKLVELDSVLKLK